MSSLSCYFSQSVLTDFAINLLFYVIEIPSSWSPPPSYKASGAWRAYSPLLSRASLGKSRCNVGSPFLSQPLCRVCAP